MPNGRREGGTGNTAIVAIVVLILVAVVAFMIFFWNGGDADEPAQGPDVELQVEPPENGGGGDGSEPLPDGGGE